MCRPELCRSISELSQRAIHGSAKVGLPVGEAVGRGHALEIGVGGAEARGEEVVPDGEIEALEVSGLRDDAGPLEDGVLVEAGEAFAEPGDLPGVIDDAEAARVPVVEGLMGDEGCSVRGKGLFVRQEEIEDVGEAAAAAGCGVLVRSDDDGVVGGDGIVPEVSLGGEDLLDFGGDLGGRKRPSTMHGEQHRLAFHLKAVGGHIAAGEEGVTHLGPGAREVLMAAGPEAGDEGLGWGQTGEVEGDADVVGSGDRWGHKPVLAGELEQRGAEEGAVFEGVLQRSGPVLGEVVRDGDRAGAGGVEDPARRIFGGDEGCVRADDVESGDRAVELGLTGPLRGQKDHLRAGTANGRSSAM